MVNKLVVVLGIFSTTFLFVNGQTHGPHVVLNHLLITVDSLTYHDILNSKILNSNFAYAHERQLQSWSGIYIFGQDNYIEIFKPTSFKNEYTEAGTSWICYSSMKANYLRELNKKSENMFEFSSDNEFDYLSLYFHDSTNLVTTWEMKKSHYENWAKKTFHDSVSFLSTDYNSPADSDSTKNYLFKNVLGIKVTVNPVDSINICDYMKFIGYSKTIENGNNIRFSNAVDFIEIDFQKGVEFSRISTIYLALKHENKTEQIKIGKTVLSIKGNRATWEFDVEYKE
jgi:hypothetical protein